MNTRELYRAAWRHERIYIRILTTTGRHAAHRYWLAHTRHIPQYIRECACISGKQREKAVRAERLKAAMEELNQQAA